MKRLMTCITMVLLLNPLASADEKSDIQSLKQTVKQLEVQLQSVKCKNVTLEREIEELKKSMGKKPQKLSFKSRLNKPVSFYGFVKTDASYSDSKAVGKDYILFALPKYLGNHKNYKDNDFNINFKHSRFGFLIRKNEGNYHLLGNFEFDFYGNLNENDDNPDHAGIRVRKAYVQFGRENWNVLAGLDWMLLTQLYPHLSNFPSGAMMGNIGYRIPQVRFTRFFKAENQKLTTQIAFDKVWGDPDPALSPYIDTGSDSGVPDVQGRIAYDTSVGNTKVHIGTIGHYGREQVDLKNGSNKDLKTYSYGLEFKVSPINWAYLSGKVWKGKNLGGWYTGGIGQGVLYIDDRGLPSTKLRSTPVDAREIDAEGGWVELGLKPNEKLSVHLGTGIDNPDNNDLRYNGKYAGLARLQNTMYYSNAMYKLTPSLGLMGEYLRVKTNYPAPLKDGIVNRLQGSLLYFF